MKAVVYKEPCSVAVEEVPDRIEHPSAVIARVTPTATNVVLRPGS